MSRKKKQPTEEVKTYTYNLLSDEDDCGKWYVTVPCDPINQPAHYTQTEVEPINAIEAWELPYHTGNAVKYIARAGRKTSCPIEDLKKARWYLDRYINKLEKK